MPDDALDWQAIPIPLPDPGGVAGFKVGELALVLCHAEGEPYVLEDQCPHAAVPLSDGRLRGCILECPFHGGKVDVRDGQPAAPPIRRAAASYPVRRAESGTLEIGLPPTDPS